MVHLPYAYVCSYGASRPEPLALHLAMSGDVHRNISIYLLHCFCPHVLRLELSLAAPLWTLCVLLQMRLFVSFDDMIG